MCSILGKRLNFMLVIVLWLVGVQNTIDLKNLNACLSESEKL